MYTLLHNPIKGYHLVETGIVQKGDYIGARGMWIPAKGFIGKEIINGIIKQNYLVTNWYVCRKNI